MQLSRLKRKCRTSDDSTSGYINGLKYTHAFHDPITNQQIPIETLSEQIKSCLEKNDHLLNLFQIITAFQTAIQCICENLVLLDRVLLIKEMGMEGGAIKVVKDELSPRCFALVARKPVG